MPELWVASVQAWGSDLGALGHVPLPPRTAVPTERGDQVLLPAGRRGRRPKLGLPGLHPVPGTWELRPSFCQEAGLSRATCTAAHGVPPPEAQGTPPKSQ